MAQFAGDLSYIGADIAGWTFASTKFPSFLVGLAVLFDLALVRATITTSIPVVAGAAISHEREVPDATVANFGNTVPSAAGEAAAGLGGVTIIRRRIMVTKSKIAVAAATAAFSLASPAFAQAFDPTQGTGNVLPSYYGQSGALQAGIARYNQIAPSGLNSPARRLVSPRGQ